MEETDVETESVIGREATPDDAPKPKKAKPSQTTSSRYAHLMISDSSASFDSPEGPHWEADENEEPAELMLSMRNARHEWFKQAALPIAKEQWNSRST